MNLLCSECYELLSNPYVAIISAHKENSSVQEGPGLGICSVHIANQLPQIRERYQRQRWEGLTEGVLYLVDFAESESSSHRTIDSAAPTQRTGIVGYLLDQEMKKYLPRTLELITARLEELRVFVVD